MKAGEPVNSNKDDDTVLEGERVGQVEHGLDVGDKPPGHLLYTCTNVAIGDLDPEQSFYPVTGQFLKGLFTNFQNFTVYSAVSADT